ncbi:MAG: hypothetical protein JXB47_05875 [Anaerolineae bacterium]|nr:hypothetical protein [Anaerolineae bacterium]
MKKLRWVERFNAQDALSGWVRILPVGTFARFGRKATVTPQAVREMAAHFGRVPETGVPVTRAHDDAAGKVGDVVEVQARADGLWGRIRWTAAGLRLLAEGAFRYLSPEVVWGPVDYDGRTVRNVLAGLSLVNQPFFGRAVSLFRLRPQRSQYGSGKERFMETDMKTRLEDEEPTNGVAQGQPKLPPRRAAGLLDRLLGWLANRLAALLIKWLLPQAQDTQARLDDLEAQQEEQTLEARFGALEGAGLGKGWAWRLAQVARYDAALADAIAARFEALLAQSARAALFGEIGGSGGQAAGPVEQFNAAVKSAMYTYGLDYAGAGKKIAAEQPELYTEYQRAVTNRL